VKKIESSKCKWRNMYTISCLLLLLFSLALCCRISSLVFIHSKFCPVLLLFIKSPRYSYTKIFSFIWTKDISVLSFYWLNVHTNLHAWLIFKDSSSFIHMMMITWRRKKLNWYKFHASMHHLQNISINLVFLKFLFEFEK
jgi:hypothetical protein